MLRHVMGTRASSIFWIHSGTRVRVPLRNTPEHSGTDFGSWSKQHYIKYITELENKLETYLTACAAENVKPEAQHEGRGKVEYMIRNLNSLFKKELARSMRAANMRKDTVTYKWARDECMEIDKMLLENNELSDDSEDKKKNDRKPKPGTRAARKAARNQAAAAKAEEGDAEELEKLKRIMPWYKEWKLGDRWAPKDV